MQLFFSGFFAARGIEAATANTGAPA